jgi:hypothetical protein
VRRAVFCITIRTELPGMLGNPSLVLRSSCVPEKVGVNKEGVNQKLFPLEIKI